VIDDRIIGEHYVENTWACTSCRHVNRGRDMLCAECGSPKDKSEDDAIAPEGAAPVVDPELLKKAVAGPNRLCRFCDSQNRALDGKCPQCGAPREEPVREKPSTPTPSFDRAVASYAVTRTAASPAEASNGGSIFIGVAALLLTSCLVYWGVWLFKPHRTHATVTSASWSVTKNLLTRTTLHGSDWGSPYGAFNVSCQTRYYGTTSCNAYDCNFRQESYECRPHRCNCSTYDTTTPMRNGFSKVTTHERCNTCYDMCSRQTHDTCWHQCPVYRDWCGYDYYTWPVTDTQTTSGTGQDIHDPVLQAGEFQKIDQREIFKVRFEHKHFIWDLSPTRADYGRYTIGSDWSVEVTHAGGFKILGPKGL